jgi:CubicO group peptidase (beta-lactamase class C family)
MLLRHGSVVAEGWWSPYAPEIPHLLYSLSKSFTSTALGFAVAEHLVDLDATVLSYFPELDAEITDPRSRSMLVRHIAAMASGHRSDTADRAAALDPLDMVRGFLLIPPDEEPGTFFAYNQPCTFTVAAIVQRVSGGSLLDFLRPRLFEPLGIGEAGWIRDASGREIGYSGLHATTDAIAKLGQLYLRDGRWNGGQLLPSGWVAQASARQVGTPLEGNPDWQQGYGFQFWMARHGYRGDGAFGQFCVVLPEQDTVLAITAQTENMQQVLNLAWAHLLPALVDGAIESADGPDAELGALLASLRLSPAPGSLPPAGAVGQSFRAAPGNDQPTLTDVVLAGEPAGSWTVTLIEGVDRLVAALGIGEWVVTDAVATSGGWVNTDDATDWIGIDVAFIQTPHRLHLRCDPATGLFESRWMTAPLHSGPLTRLRMPRPT